MTWLARTGPAAAPIAVGETASLQAAGRLRCAGCFLGAALLAAQVPADGQPPRVFYSKSFPGSVPAYVEIRVERDGKAEYKEAPNDDQPVRFQLKTGDADEIFALVEKLDRFRRPLESGLKVANMGLKTFRVDGPSEKSEVQFNYSQDLDALGLHDWFEKMTETVGHRILLERAVRYDRLGVNKILLHLQVTVEKNRLTAGDQLLPMLDRIAKNESFLNMARERAAALAEWIRNPKPKEE